MGAPGKRWPVRWTAIALVLALGLELVVASRGGPGFSLAALPRPSAPRVERAALAAVAGLLAPAKPAITVRARVVDAAGPVAGATVSIGDGSGPVLRTAKSGAGGVVAFTDLEPGAYQLWASRGAQVSPLARLATSKSSELELTLEPGTPLFGRALAPDSLDPGARAVIIPIDIDHAVFFAALDDQGRFAVSALPRGRWRVRVEAPGFIADREVPVTARGERAEVEVALRPSGEVSGVVLDAAGRPVAGATLALERRGGASGAAAADWALSRAGIRWVHPLAGMRQMPGRDSRRFGARRPGDRPPECGGGHCGVDIGGRLGSVVHAAAAGRVVRVVTDPDRRAGRFVAIEHDFGLVSFYMHLHEIRFDLSVGQRVGAGEPIGTLGRSGVFNSGPHLHFAISQETGGRPWFIDPEPMLYHAIVLPEDGSLALAAAPDRARAAAGPAPWRIETDAEGRFRVAGLAPGSYRATAIHPELAPGSSAPFAVRGGETTGGVVIELEPGVTVFGLVTAGADPVSGARIVAEAGEGESLQIVARATTDAAGRYQLRPLAGTVTVRALSRDLGEAERAVTLAPGAAPRREISFELARLEAELSGRVLDEGGFAVKGATVRVLAGPRTARRQLVTGEGGRFAVAAEADGHYRIEVASADHPRTELTLESGREATVVLAAAGAISALVRDADSRSPLAGLRVTARGPRRARATAVTGDGGIGELAPLAPGRWTLSVHARGYTPATVALEVGAGTRATPTLELSRGAVLAGVLRDGDGVRVAGAEVRCGRVSTTTDGEGRFRVEDAPTGAVEIWAEEGDASGVLELEVAPGDELITLELRLE